METKVKSRDWVKNAAIVFLSVLLVLTFFSNTIMNRSLPEVSTQLATNGSIVAKVRGTGIVVANGTYQEKAQQTREIRAVMIKSGQEINAGDPMFILGEGDSEELEALQESLRSLQVSYQRSSINTPTFDYTLEEKKIKTAKSKLDSAELAVAAAKKQLEAATNIPEDQIEAAEKALADATAAYNEELERAEGVRKQYKDEVDLALQEYNKLIKQRPVEDVGGGSADAPTTDDSSEGENNEITGDGLGDSTGTEDSGPSALEQQIEEARLKLEEAQKKLDDLEFPALTALKNQLDQKQNAYDTLLSAGGAAKSAYDAAVSERDTAETEYDTLVYDLEQQKIRDGKTQQLAYLDLSDIGMQIAKVQEKIKELSGGDENQIIAKVSGTVQSVEVTAGSTVAEDTVLATIEVPDMGYNLSFSVTNEQARRLKLGDTATVSNYYWGNEIVATLSAIKTDPKSPMTNKELTFELEGDVTAGGELSLSVGQKSAGYDVVVPNSAIKNDTNGNFVYVIEAKNSPLGNRYIAKRASVEVLAADDNNSAVTGDIENGDYVITISNAPIQNGDMVRMADS